MATEIRMRNPKTGEEIIGYQGYSWTSLLFCALPTLLRGDILLGLGVALATIVLALAGAAAGLPTWAASAVTGGIWGFFYNDIHMQRLVRAGYQVVPGAPAAAGETR